MGLYDRDYMQPDRGNIRRGPGWTSGLSATTILILVNAGVWLLLNYALNQATPVGRRFGPDSPEFQDTLYWQLFENFTVSFNNVVHEWRIWTLLSSAIAHEDLGHIVFNMLAFWITARELEMIHGKAEMFAIYVCAALTSGLAYIAISHFQHTEHIPALGASGVVYATMVMFACRFPHRIFYVNFFIPVRAWLLVVFYIASDFLGLFHTQSHVAHSAHLGGALFGFLYWKNRWRILPLVRKLLPRRKQKIDWDNMPF